MRHHHRHRFHHHPEEGPDREGPVEGAPEEEEEGFARFGRRKERILHTRVSRQLSEEIRRVAEDLRVPVSNLVRNVLEEAFHVVEQVSDDVGGIVEEVIEEAERARDRFRRRAWRHRDHWHEQEDARRAAATPTREEPPTPPHQERASEPERGARMAFPGVVGWQPLVLDVARRCACDDRPLGRGEDAWVGLGEQGLTRFYLCGPCMAARRTGN
jgi:hypothetical protein